MNRRIAFATALALAIAGTLAVAASLLVAWPTRLGDLPPMTKGEGDSSTGESNIFAGEVDTLQQLTGDEYSFNPRWSPDGGQIAYLHASSYEDCCGYRGIQVWVMDADGGNARPVSDQDLEAQDLQWTPDGAAVLATVPSRQGRSVVFGASIIRIDIVEGSVTTLVEDYTAEGMSLSPDGSQIVGSGRKGIRVTDLETGEVSIVAQGVFGAPRLVQWSPDGAWLAVEGSAEGTESARIWAWNLSEERLVPLEIGRGEAYGYAWVGPSELIYCYLKVGDDGERVQTTRAQLGEAVQQVRVSDAPPAEFDDYCPDWRDDFLIPPTT